MFHVLKIYIECFSYALSHLLNLFICPVTLGHLISESFLKCLLNRDLFYSIFLPWGLLRKCLLHWVWSERNTLSGRSDLWCWRECHQWLLLSSWSSSDEMGVFVPFFGDLPSGNLPLAGLYTLLWTSYCRSTVFSLSLLEAWFSVSSLWLIWHLVKKDRVGWILQIIRTSHECGYYCFLVTPPNTRRTRYMEIAGSQIRVLINSHFKLCV